MLNAVIAILTYVLDYNMLRVLKYTNMRLFNLCWVEYDYL